MSLTNFITQLGAAGAGGPTGSYISLVTTTSPYFILLDHTTAGSVSLADTYTLQGQGRDVGFSPDGSYIGVAHNTQYFKILDHTTLGVVSLESSSQSLSSDDIKTISFSPSGNYVAVGYSNKINLLDYSNPSSVSNVATYTLSGTGSTNAVRGVSFSPDGNYIAVAHNDSPRLTLLDHTTPGSLSLATTYTISAPAGDYFGAYSVAFSPDGNYIAVGMYASPRVVLLDHTTPGSLTLADTDASVTGAAKGLSFSPDGSYLAVAHSTSPFFTLLNSGSGSLSFAAQYTLSANDAESVAFSPDGKYIAVGHNSTTTTKFTLLSHNSGSVALSDTYTGTGIVNGVAFSPN